jgi:hypothetical protein
VLAALQAIVAVALLHDFLFGPKYFAFVDVGSDTFAQFVPALMHMATPEAWQSAWSFKVGMGGVAPVSVGPFSLLAIAGGPELVLDLRIWVYLAKILAGGAAFYAFALATGARRESAVICALAYSYCGYIAVDGQWDGHATEFVAYAFLLWALARHARQPSGWLVALAIAFAAYGGVFLFSVGVFFVYVLIAESVASGRPAETLARWLRSVLPFGVVGLLLAAPVVLPNIYLLLESPRITGPQAVFADRMRELFTLNDTTTTLIELAGLFHKNLLGAGSQHFGWMNYLEGPGGYVGMLALLVIPQLWRGTRADRRVLLAGSAVLAAYLLLPAVRYLAFGFGLDYFRVNSLWVSLLLLTLALRALGVMAEHGAGLRLLAGTGTALVLLVLHLRAELFPPPSMAHTLALATFGAVALVLVALLAIRKLEWRTFATLAMGLVATEASVTNYVSFNGKREAVTRQTPGYADPSLDALAFIRARDPGFHRIEKTYNSVSFCDALAQGYMGVKSYWFQGAGAVGFFSDLDLIPRRSRTKNFTNWLPNFGDRFALYSLAGVKYLVSPEPLAWPGFRKIHTTGALSVFENELALPLGVVYEHQYPKDRLAKMSPEAKDITLLNAVIVEKLRGDAPKVYDARQMMKQGPTWLEDNYFTPARQLQKRGLSIERFSDGHITGKVDSDVPGVLVFSIPFARGWTVAVDGVEQPVFSANLGLLATDIARGPHSIELRYALPGLLPGLLAGLAGLLALLALGLRERRLPDASATGAAP